MILKGKRFLRGKLLSRERNRKEKLGKLLRTHLTNKKYWGRLTLRNLFSLGNLRDFTKRSLGEKNLKEDDSQGEKILGVKYGGEIPRGKDP